MISNIYENGRERFRKPLLYPTELRGHADYDIERGRGSLGLS